MSKLPGDAIKFYVVNGEAGVDNVPGEAIAIYLEGQTGGSVTGDLSVTSVTTTGGLTVGGDSELDGALNHDGATAGFYGAVPAAKPGATNDIKDSLVTLGLITDAGATPLDLDGGAATVGTLAVEGVTVTLTAGPADIVLDTVTGTKIGTDAAQKLGFYDATPIVQAANTTDLKLALTNLGLIATGGATPLDLDEGALRVGAVVVEGVTVDLTAGPADLVLDTTTGTKIGTATSQKIGFFNATPVVQAAHIADPTGGGTADAEARSAINAILVILENLGLNASS